MTGPPEVRRRDQQISRSLRSQGTELTDNGLAVRRIMARIFSVGRRREMPGWPAAELQQAFISFSNDQRRRVFRQRLVRHFSDALDQAIIGIRIEAPSNRA